MKNWKVFGWEIFPPFEQMEVLFVDAKSSCLLSYNEAAIRGLHLRSVSFWVFERGKSSLTGLGQESTGILFKNHTFTVNVLLTSVRPVIADV